MIFKIFVEYLLYFVSGQYAGRPADYLFMLLFNWICCVIVGLIAEMPVSNMLLNVQNSNFM